MHNEIAANQNKGRVIKGRGPIIDVQFTIFVPPIGRVLVIHELNLLMEVLQYAEHKTVRCMALGPTEALAYGMEVVDTQEPLSIPLSKDILGRVINAFGQPLDDLPAIVADENRPTSQQPPSFLDVKSQLEIYETGIKSIDFFHHSLGVVRLVCLVVRVLVKQLLLPN